MDGESEPAEYEGEQEDQQDYPHGPVPSIEIMLSEGIATRQNEIHTGGTWAA
jgi:hypothetical protein